MTTTQRGFTFIELLVVAGTIGVLVAVALPLYTAVEGRAQYVEVAELAADARRHVGEFYARWGRLPRDNHEAGMGASETYVGSYVDAVEIRDGIITVRRKAGDVVFEPSPNRASPTGPLTWGSRCGWTGRVYACP